MSKKLGIPRKVMLTLEKTETLCKFIIIGCQLTEADLIRYLKMAVREISGVSIDSEHAKKIIESAHKEITS